MNFWEWLINDAMVDDVIKDQVSLDNERYGWENYWWKWLIYDLMIGNVIKSKACLEGSISVEQSTRKNLILLM